MRIGLLPRRGSQRLTVLLLAVAVPPAATLVWLGVQLLRQDRALLAQRDLELRQVVMQSAIRSLEQAVADAERHFDGPLPDGMVRFTVTAAGVVAQPADGVLWLPAPRERTAAEDGRFADAERLEFQGSADRALAVYRETARSANPRVRAGALLRLGRVLRQQSRWDDAMKAYRRLAEISDVAIANAPADLQARRALCAILAEADRTSDLVREAARLRADLLAGLWTLDRPAWELTADEIERWTGRPPPDLTRRRMFSLLADVVWNEHPVATESRWVVDVEHTPMTVLWRARGAEATALAISPTIVRMWAAAATGPRSGTRLDLIAPSGAVVAGPATTGSVALKAATADTGLPWTIALDGGDSSAARAELANRRRLLSAGLAAILLLLAGGSYFLWRVMQRELAVARLQTEFVSAVSHEFRTPLTSLRHVTELLEENDAMPPERRRTFYEALDRNTERLRRLVESLLDFARMESGRRPYAFQPVDASALTVGVVADFQKEVAPRGFTIDLEERTGDARVRADATSLTNALWNLLDNAVKYSPEASQVRVGVERRNGYVEISVRDQGLGIPANERPAIFDKFHRGEQARALGINGTGIGLAMVHEIVRAHHGHINVDSEPGRGSTFTIVLPAEVIERGRSDPR